MITSLFQSLKISVTVLVALTLLGLTASPATGQTAKPPAEKAVVDKQPRRQLTIGNKPWTGDFDRMLARRMIRVLVPYSRTLYFNDKGQERGLVADTVRDFERYINRQHQTGKRPVTVYMIPTTRDRLLPDVAAGLGDIAAGNLTVTPERLELVDFVAPEDQKGISEIVVTGPKSAPVEKVGDLSGRRVHVRPSSSYYESLQALNKRFKEEGRPEAIPVPVPDTLEDEDMLEMLNAGLLEAIIVDSWKSRMWGQILPRIRPAREAKLRTAGHTGWAIRKESPQLRAALEDFYHKFLKKQGVLEFRHRQYLKRVKQMKDATAAEELKRFEETIELFKKYGDRYQFDPLMLAAQGYQESQLNQKAKSQVGAIGVMQVMPRTGRELKVGDIRITEPNIHAGTKYLDQLMTRYFADAHFSEGNRPLFAFASYNAGPGNMAKMRKLAGQRGLDPDKWFNNVELVVAEKIGQETTTYVRNIYKYYVAYRLTLEAEEATRKAREQVYK
ncbi:MAG: transglycosylase SLT domain-containing protein [Desulfobacterota bacterium]|jgi:membrane-bound lytic murein transglycosylase MltF|nr:transglycosylase SLT domain-containing protein [Thermodesulfobacteriota bacterium]